MNSLVTKPNYKKSPHPLYEIFGNHVSKKNARDELKLGDEKIILNFGLVRDYKGLDIQIAMSF